MRNDLLYLGTKELWRLANKENLWGRKKGLNVSLSIIALYIELITLVASGVVLSFYGGSIRSLPMVIIAGLSLVLAMCLYAFGKHCIAKILCYVKEYKEKHGIALVNE